MLLQEAGGYPKSRGSIFRRVRTQQRDHLERGANTQESAVLAFCAQFLCRHTEYNQRQQYVRVSVQSMRRRDTCSGRIPFAYVALNRVWSHV